jgi:5-methylcytosine-specific restriction protein A
MKLATLKPKVALLDSGPKLLTSPSWQDDRRGSRQSRGYGPTWDRLRLVILRRDNYLCQCRHCKAKGRILPATEVDHIKAKGLWRILYGSLSGVDDHSNLQTIAHACHLTKTEEDRQAIRALMGGKTPGG